MRKTFLIISLLTSMTWVYSQGPGYSLAFNQIFDNREYFSSYAFPQTIFGARLDASLDFQVDSMHRFYAGFSYLYEHGSTVLGVAPGIILYYQYENDHLDMTFGSFPRKERIQLPAVFLHDTLQYFRPNVEGARIAYRWNSGMFYSFVDWTGRVSENRRETFLVGLHSRIDVHQFFIEPAFLMYHNARSYNPNDSLPLQDNGLISGIAGYEVELSHRKIKMEISAGYIASYNRYRPQAFEWNSGMISNIKLHLGVFGLHGVYYFGGPINFELGDPFYNSGNYGRMDFFVDPFRKANIDSKISWNVHVVPGEGIHHSQQLLIRIEF